MSPEESRGHAPTTFDPEAEQEVDFGRYWRLIVARWWLVLAGFVIGAVIGYAISLGGTQVFKATVNLYLGQPYSASGSVQLAGRDPRRGEAMQGEAGRLQRRDLGAVDRRQHLEERPDP